MPDGRKIIFTGKLAPGVSRGKPLIDLFYYQITNAMGYEPFEGTLNIKIREPVNLNRFATKYIERKLLDGSRIIDLFIAPVTIVIREEEYVELVENKRPDKRDLRAQIEELKARQEKIRERERQTENLLYKEPVTYDCFAIQERDAIDHSVIELIDKHNLRERLNLEDGDIIDVILYERPTVQRDFLGRPK